MRVSRIRDTFTLFFCGYKSGIQRDRLFRRDRTSSITLRWSRWGPRSPPARSRSLGCYLRGAVAVCGTRQREGADPGQLRFLPAKPAAPVRLKTLQPGEVRAFGNRPPMVVELALRRAVERAMTAVRKRGV